MEQYRLRESAEKNTWDVVTPDHQVFLTVSSCTETVAWLVVVALNASHSRALGA